MTIEIVPTPPCRLWQSVPRYRESSRPRNTEITDRAAIRTSTHSKPEHASEIDPRKRRSTQIALALAGGGARAAYQAGVLLAIATRFPEFRFPYLTGVSAGAINISLLANHTGSLREQASTLASLWRELRMENVFSTGSVSLLCRAMRIGLQMAVGMPPGISNLNGMVNTQPLRQFLMRALNSEDGRLPGIRQNIDRGHLETVALTALSYGTGYTVTFHEGRFRANWQQPLRRTVETPLTVEHIMASSALPLFFPPVQIDGDWYGDGGIRLVNPLAPALHTGADRILAISNHYLGGDINRVPTIEPPTPATVVGALYNAVFLDQLDQDVIEMQMINRLVRELPNEKRHGMRDVKLMVIRPSENIGAMAYELRNKLPRTLNYLMTRFGADEVRSQDFLSTVMFQTQFIEQLIELGQRDGESHCDELAHFIASSSAVT